VTPNLRSDWIIVCFDLRTKTYSKVEMLRTAKVYFAIFLKTIIFKSNEAHVSTSFTTSFYPFSLKFGKNVAR